jgi:hypothetical protein
VLCIGSRSCKDYPTILSKYAAKIGLCPSKNGLQQQKPRELIPRTRSEQSSDQEGRVHPEEDNGTITIQEARGLLLDTAIGGGIKKCP